MALKATLRSALTSMGVSVSRIRPGPYEELWAWPRYTPTTVQLLGRAFRIPDSHSFIASYREIFLDGIYRFNPSSDRPVIIDCGANCGTSIRYFMQHYPRARVTGVEADPAIFRMLAANCAHLPVRLLQKAVSHDHEPVQFYSDGADGGRLGHTMDAPRGVTRIDCVTLDELIEGPVDFLKMDIEGAEGPVLAACHKLQQVRQLFIEYHSFRDSPQTLDRILAQLSANGFRYYIRHVFCPVAPLTSEAVNLGMDLQLNIFAKRHP